MDIKGVDAAASAAERAAVDALLGEPRSAWDGGTRGDQVDAHFATVGGGETRALRHLLLPALQALQARAGWISEGGLGYVCERLNVPPADAWGVATFYALLATEPRPPVVVHVCDDIACKCRGADRLIAEIEASAPSANSAPPSAPRASPLAPRASHSAPRASQPAPRAAWQRSPCLGMCDRAPAAFVTVAGRRPRAFSIAGVTADTIRELLAGADAIAGSEDPAYTDVEQAFRPAT